MILKCGCPRARHHQIHNTSPRHIKRSHPVKMAKLLKITGDIQGAQLWLRDLIASLWQKGLSFFPCMVFVAKCRDSIKGIPEGAWTFRGHH